MSKAMEKGLMPLKDGDTVCILGGGPGGAGCALALKRQAAQLGKDVRVVIFEQKKFQEHRQYNQCIGVLSPPLEEILHEKLGVELPHEIIVKEITGYCLHSDFLDINLDGEEHGKTYAINRVKFDAFMLEKAQQAGAEVFHQRATGMEILEDDVLVYSEGDNCRASVVVGAFGLDDGSCKVLEQASSYKAPECLNTIIARLYPGAEFMEQVGSTIHAFLLSKKGLEFGAVTPKNDHLSINVAGKKISSQVMLEFLRSDPVQRFLPPHQRREKPLHYFKGKFPIAPAKNLFGNRYVTIGDAAGLIRPFKGKGINSACLTGFHAANCIMNHGVSRGAFENYIQDCSELTGDLWYGKVFRVLTNISTRLKFMDRVLKVAERDPVFMECLFNCVSGHKPYKQIVSETVSIKRGLDFFYEGLRHFIFRQSVVPETRVKPG